MKYNIELTKAEIRKIENIVSFPIEDAADLEDALRIMIDSLS